MIPLKVINGDQLVETSGNSILHYNNRGVHLALYIDLYVLLYLLANFWSARVQNSS